MTRSNRRELRRENERKIIKIRISARENKKKIEENNQRRTEDMKDGSDED